MSRTSSPSCMSDSSERRSLRTILQYNSADKTVEFDRQLADLLRCEGRPLHIIACTVDAVFAIIDAVIRHQYLKQRDTPAIRRKAVADATRRSIAEFSFLSPAIRSARRTCHIVFGGIRKNLQLLLCCIFFYVIVCNLCTHILIIRTNVLRCKDFLRTSVCFLFINFLKTSKQAKQNFHFTCFKITPLPVSSPTQYLPQ